MTEQGHEVGGPASGKSELGASGLGARVTHIEREGQQRLVARAGKRTVIDEMDAAFGRTIPPISATPVRRFRSTADVGDAAGGTDAHQSLTRRALNAATEAASFQYRVPTGSRNPLAQTVKLAVRTFVAFYMRFVVQQLNLFAKRITFALDQVVAQQEQLQADHTGGLAYHDFVEGLKGPVLPDEVLAVATELGAGADGRVLVADPGSPAAVTAFEAAGIDAFALLASQPGTTPSDAGAEPEADPGADVRYGDLAGTVAALGPASLGGALLAGWVDTEPPEQRLRLMSQVIAACRPGALVVVATNTQWEATTDPVLVDLAPARPFAPATWRHVLWRCGCELVDATAAGTATGSASHYQLVVARVGAVHPTGTPADGRAS